MAGLVRAYAPARFWSIPVHGHGGRPRHYRPPGGGRQDPSSLRVSNIATKDVVTIGPDQDVEQARELMAQHQLDRLVVVEEGDRLVEIMSDADLRKDEGPERRPTADGQFGGGLSTGGNPPLWIVRDGAGPAAWDVTGDGRSGGRQGVVGGLRGR
jgi:hypothetical protein